MVFSRLACIPCWTLSKNFVLMNWRGSWRRYTTKIASCLNWSVCSWRWTCLSWISACTYRKVWNLTDTSWSIGTRGPCSSYGWSSITGADSLLMIMLWIITHTFMTFHISVVSPCKIRVPKNSKPSLHHTKCPLDIFSITILLLKKPTILSKLDCLHKCRPF
jgi:hypothetical protein